MKIIDLTGSISENMWTYGLPFLPFKRVQISDIKSHGYIAYEYKIFSHMGTHIDAQAHFNELDNSVDEIEIENLYGSAIIITIENCKPSQEITLEDILPYESKILENDIVLFATGWDSKWEELNYATETPYLSNQVAEFLIKKKIKLVGTDTALCCNPQNGLFSISQDESIPDKLFLKNGIPYINGLVNLKSIKKERITFLALPLKIKKAEGTPVRAVAFI